MMFKMNNNELDFCQFCRLFWECLNDVYAGEQCKSPSCPYVVDILVYADKRLRRYNHHESHQIVIKSPKRN